MARDHAEITLTMWGDDDWRKLTPAEQHLYLLLLTSPSLSFCGVADWRPGRIAQLAAGWDEAAVREAARGLVDRLYLVIDEASEEVLIRSFIRNDGLMKRPNVAIAMATAHAGIASARIRGVIVHELRRLHAEQPDLKGWGPEKVRKVLDREAVDPSPNPSRNPSGNRSRNPSGKGLPNPSENPSGDPCPTPAPTPAPAPSSSNEEEKEQRLLSGKPDEPPGFAEFYAAYPRKEARGRAVKAWRTAVKRATVETIMDALASYTFSPDRQFQPLPATWLNDQHWHDEKAALPMYDVSKLPEPRAGWSTEQLDMVLGKDMWQVPEPPADMDEDAGYLWQQQERRRHFALRVQAALRATGRTA